VLQGTTFDLPKYFKPIKVIGSGAYGLVISAKNTRTGESVAIKKVSGVFEDLEDGKRVVRESRLLRHLRHPQVIEILDIIPAPVSKKAGLTRSDPRRANDVYMVLPLMDSDLHKVISSKVALKDEHVKYFLYQLLRACKHIHSKGVLHRDIKPANVLVNANCDLKLCDFGLARSPPTSEAEKDLQSTMTEYVVTRWYRAPELLLCLTEYDEAIDVWAVGCVFAELLLREPLFAGRDYAHQLELIADALWLPPTARLEKWVHNRQALNFVAKLRAKQRQRRANAKQARRAQEKQQQQVEVLRQSGGVRSITPIKTVTDADADLGLKRSLRQRLVAKGIDGQGVSLLMSMLEVDPCMRVGVEGAMSHPYLADLHAQHWPGGDEEEDSEKTCEEGGEAEAPAQPETSSPPGSTNNVTKIQRVSPCPPGAEEDELEEVELPQPVRLLSHEDFRFESMGKLSKTELQRLMMAEIKRYRPNF